MKRFTSILAVTALSTSAFAADTVDMKWNAEMRTRYTSEANYGTTKGSNFGNFAQRNMLGLHLSKGENFQGHVSLVNNFFWGGVGNTLGATQAPSTTASDHNVLLVNEAYGWWKANDMVAVKFGRSAFEIAGGFVSSSYDWQADPYAYDGFWTMWDFEPVSLNLFGAKLDDSQTSSAGTTVAGNSDPESVMYGAVVGFKTLPEFFKKAEVHVLQNNNETTDRTGTANGATNRRIETLRYGLFVNGDTAGFDYRLVYDMYSGKQKTFTGGSSTDIDLTGNMMDIGAGYSFAEMMGLRLGVAYHMDSGHDEAAVTTSSKTYIAGAYDKFSHGGTYMDAVSFGNLTFMSVSASIKPMDDLTAGLRWTKFDRTSDKATVVTSAGSVGTGTSAKDIGSEIDVTLNKTYGDNFSIWALYGSFTAGDVIKNGGGPTSPENHTRMQVQGKLTF